MRHNEVTRLTVGDIRTPSLRQPAPTMFDLRSTLARYKRPLRYVMGVFYVVAGSMHFVLPEVYVQIIPPLFPRRLALVYLSGLAEIGLGIGVMVPQTKRLAAWGLIALLVAIFPANIYMATHDVTLTVVPAWASSPSAAATWARLPFQAVFMLWAWWYTQPEAADPE